MIYNSQEELDQAVKLWQKRLRLQDWVIVATLASVHEMALNNAAAEIDVLYKQKRAVINVLREQDLVSNKFVDGKLNVINMEASLVHELLHIHWWRCAPESEDLHDEWEQSTDVLANCIVNAYRSQPNSPQLV